MNDLAKIRNKIDTFDNEIIKFLIKRMELALLTPEYKEATEDAEREEQIRKKIGEIVRTEEDRIFISKLYDMIFEESKSRQKLKSDKQIR